MPAKGAPGSQRTVLQGQKEVPVPPTVLLLPWAGKGQIPDRLAFRNPLPRPPHQSRGNCLLKLPLISHSRFGFGGGGPGRRASVQLTKLILPGTRPHPGTGGILALACRATGLFLRLGRDGERRGYDLEHSVLGSFFWTYGFRGHAKATGSEGNLDFLAGSWPLGTGWVPRSLHAVPPHPLGPTPHPQAKSRAVPRHLYPQGSEKGTG